MKKPVKKQRVAVCAECKTEFETKTCAKFCSAKCREEAQKRQKAAYKAGVRKKAAGMRVCHDCGKPTYDFRCPACWKKLRDGGDSGMTDNDFLYA